MHKITAFQFNDSSSVRTLTDSSNEPWFVAKDVCDVLGLSNPTETLKSLDDDELTSEKLRSGGIHRDMNLISESGLYTLIIRSNKPQAKKFRRWVTKEVLPAIRKTGKYDPLSTGQQLSKIKDGLRESDIHFKELSISMRLSKLIGKRGDEQLRHAAELTTLRTGINPLEYFQIALPEKPAAMPYQNPVDLFIQECCEINPNFKIPKRSLHMAYKKFCKKNGFMPQHAGTFSQSIFNGREIKSSRPSNPNGNGRITAYVGITLKPEYLLKE